MKTSTLIWIGIGTLAVGGAAAYLLSRRQTTLTPYQQSIAAGEAVPFTEQQKTNALNTLQQAIAQGYATTTMKQLDPTKQGSYAEDLRNKILYG